ncbi:WhiB family transcriptional regulator [Streptomyces sp. CA-111067]|uniref:WhiB family transcriptional regulator n=1 Tax=Streptomyces sp. CA-111067 TaxID=3240046 RepID=UPI003D96F522
MIDIDLIAVERAITGRPPFPTLNRPEQRYAVHLLTRSGRGAKDIAGLLGITTRTINRWRAQPVSLPSQPLQEQARWRENAACREVGAAFFFPSDEPEEQPLYSTGRARAVCAGCPVRSACLDDAMAREGTAGRHGRAGVWGGLSPSQRAALARARAPRQGPVPSRVEEIQGRHRADLLAALRGAA